MVRAVLSIGIVVLLALLIGIAPLGAFAAGGSPYTAPAASGATMFAHPSRPVTPSCANASGVYGNLQLTNGMVPGGPSNGTQLPEVGLAPATANFTLSILSQSELWNYNITFGDGTFATGTVLASYPGDSNGTTYLNLSHVYTVPAEYTPTFSLDYQCGNTGGGTSGWGSSFLVGGPGGYFPVTVTANVTSGTVPLPVQYTAVINDTPANASIVWILDNVSPIFGKLVYTNVTVLNVTWDGPGTPTGIVEVFYPNSSLLYGQASIPVVTVAPLVSVTVSQSPATGEGGPGPINITFFANVTNLNGTPYSGPGMFVWNFTSSIWTMPSNFTLVSVTGPTTGQEVAETFQNLRGVYFPMVVPVAASFVDPAAVTLGWNSTNAVLYWGSTPPAYSLQLEAIPSNGTAPFSTNLTAMAYPSGASNVSAPYSLTICVAPESGPGMIASGCPVFEDNVTNWSGGPLTIPLTGLSVGDYLVTGVLSVTTPPNNGTSGVVATANTTIFVRFGSTSSPSPLVVTATGSPTNGTAPLSASLGVVAAGGTAPYLLSVCEEGPSVNSTVTGACTVVASAAGWNGTTYSVPLTLNQTGYYLAIATVTDAAGNVTNASAEFQVINATTAAPLVVHASEQPSSTLAGTYTFLATIDGGVAPYAIQWAFGDGTYGSSTAGGTVSHTYAASGSYTATLIVTDADGTVRTSTVGPLVVTLPTTSGTSVLSNTYLDVLAGSVVVIVASLVVIIYAARNATERRRTEAWMASVQGAPPAAGQPPNRPRP